MRDILKHQPQLIAFAAGQDDGLVLPRAVAPGAVDHLQGHGHADLLGLFFGPIDLFSQRVGVGIRRILGDRVAVGEVFLRPVERQLRIPIAQRVPFVGFAHFSEIFKVQPQLIARLAGQDDGLVLPRAVAPGAVDHLQGHGHADLLEIGLGLLPLGDHGGIRADDDHVARIQRARGFRLGLGLVLGFRFGLFRRFRADQPADELCALRRGEVILRKGVGAVLVRRRRFHLALAAVGVKGDDDGLRGRLPLRDGRGVAARRDRVARLVGVLGKGRRFFTCFFHILDVGFFALDGFFRCRFFQGDLPADKLHALRRGEPALRQDVLAVLVRLGRFHLALAAIRVKGDDDGLRDRLPLRRQDRVAGDADHVARQVDHRRFGFRLAFGFSLGLNLRLRLGLRRFVALRLIRPRRFHRQRPARECHALRRGESALRQRVFALRRDLNAFHLALAAVRVEGDQHRLGQRVVGDHIAACVFDRVVVLLDLVLNDGVLDLLAVRVHRHAVEAEHPAGLAEALGPIGFLALAGFLGLSGFGVVAVVDIRAALVGALILATVGLEFAFVRGGLGLGFSLGFVLGLGLVRLFVEVLLVGRVLLGRLAVRGALLFLIREVQHGGGRAVRRDGQRTELLAVCHQAHGDALGPLSALVRGIVPEDRAAHGRELRRVGVGHPQLLGERAVVLDLVLDQSVLDLPAILVVRKLAEVVLPLGFRGQRLAVQLLLALEQAQGHAFGPQAVAVVVVVPFDRAGGVHRAAGRVDQPHDQAAAHQADFRFLGVLVALRHARRVQHLAAVALGGVRAVLAVHALPNGNDLLHVARQHRAPAVRRRHGLGIDVLGILVRPDLQVQRIHAQAVRVVHILPDDIHGGLALGQPLAGEGDVLHHDERLARIVGLVHRLARRVPALEVAAGDGGIVFIDALRDRDLGALEQQVGLRARFLFGLGLFAVLRDLAGGLRRHGLVLIGKPVRQALRLGVLARRQVRRTQARLHRHGHVVHRVEVRAPHHGGLPRGRAVDGRPAPVKALLVVVAAVAKHPGNDDLRVLQGRLLRDAHALALLPGGVAINPVDHVQVRQSVRGHGAVAIPGEEGIDIPAPRIGIVRMLACRRIARIPGRVQAAKDIIAPQQHLSTHVFQLGHTVVPAIAGRHVHVGLAGGRVGLHCELLHDLLRPRPDFRDIRIIGRFG